jgi:hypothetical protein
MAVQRATSSLFKKLGKRLTDACNKHKNDPIEYGNLDLPAGISNGIAQLTDCRFVIIQEGKENAGEHMFMAAGIVKLPLEHKGVPIEGLRTSVMEVIADTPGRAREGIDQHISKVQQELKKLLGPDYDPDSLSGENLEATALALQEAQPHFRFRTWKGSKRVVAKKPNGKWSVFNEDDSGHRTQDRKVTGEWATEEACKKANPYADGREPRVNHDWSGRCEYHADASASGTTDNTGSSPSPNGEPTDVTEPAAELAPDEQDLKTLAELADMEVESGSDDEARSDAAQARLEELAQEAGIDAAQLKKAPNWAAIAELIEAASGGNEPEPAEFEPVKGALYSYTFKNAKKRNVTVEVECLSVDKAKKTCELKNNADKKTKYSRIGWDSLAELAS